MFSGELFNQIYVGDYYAISDKNNLYNGLMLQEKINDFRKDSQMPILEFVDGEGLIEFISIHPDSFYYWRIKIPSDAIIIVMDDIFVTDRCYLHKKKNIDDMDVWFDRDVCVSYIKKYWNNKTKIQLARFMVNKGYDNDVLRYYPMGLKYMTGDTATDEICLKYIKKCPKIIKYLGIRTRDFYKKVVEIEPKCIHYIPDNSIDVEFLIYTLHYDGLLLEHIDIQDLETCEIAVGQNPKALKFANIQTPDMCKEAIIKNPKVFKYVIDKTLDLIYFAISIDPANIRYVTELSDDICELAVNLDASALKYIPENFQTLQMCESAVSADYKSLEYAKYQTNEMCAAAVEICPSMLQYVIEQTNKICIDAIKKNISCLKYVKNINTEIFLTAMVLDEAAMCCIYAEEEREECCIMAALLNPKCIEYMSYMMREKCTEILLSLGLTKFMEL